MIQTINANKQAKVISLKTDVSRSARIAEGEAILASIFQNERALVAA